MSSSSPLSGCPSRHLLTKWSVMIHPRFNWHVETNYCVVNWVSFLILLLSFCSQKMSKAFITNTKDGIESLLPMSSFKILTFTVSDESECCTNTNIRMNSLDCTEQYTKSFHSAINSRLVYHPDKRIKKYRLINMHKQLKIKDINFNTSTDFYATRASWIRKKKKKSSSSSIHICQKFTAFLTCSVCVYVYTYVICGTNNYGNYDTQQKVTVWCGIYTYHQHITCNS